MTACAAALATAVGGGAAGISALVRDEPGVVRTASREPEVPPAAGVAPDQPELPPVAVANVGLGARSGKRSSGKSGAGGGRVATGSGRAAARKPPGTPAAGPSTPGDPAPAAGSGAPVVSSRTVSETRPVPFRTRFVRDPSLPPGVRRVRVPGVVGEQILRYLVSYTDGRETGRRLLDAAVARQPQERVVAYGPRHGPGSGDGNGGPGCGQADDGCVPMPRGAPCPDATPASPTQPADPKPADPKPADPKPAGSKAAGSKAPESVAGSTTLGGAALDVTPKAPRSAALDAVADLALKAAGGCAMMTR